MLRKIFSTKPIEMLSSIVMVIGGAYLAIATTDPSSALIGSALTGLGGLLASWSSAMVNQVSRASEILRPQLETTGRHLGTVSSQLGRVISAVHSGQISANTAYALILQANNTLYTLVNDLQQLVGSEFDTQDLLDTVDRLDDLADRLDRLPTAGAPSLAQQEIASLREELKAIQSKFQYGQPKKYHKSPPNSKKGTEPLETGQCPYCSQAIRWPMAPGAGESATPTCPQCRKRFHAHRGPDGKIFFRSLEGEAIGDRQYAAILRKQGIRLITPELIKPASYALVDAFAAQDEGFFETWADLTEGLLEAMIERGISKDSTTCRKAREIFHKAGLFEKAPEIDEIRLLLEDGEKIYRRVLCMLTERLISADIGEVELDKLARILFGQTEDALDKSRQILQEISGFSETN